MRIVALAGVLGLLIACDDKDPVDTATTPETVDSEEPVTGDDDTGRTAPVIEDADGDGYAEEDDCDDTDPAINPSATDIAGDKVDANCDGVDGIDADGDGHASEVSGGEDCDDGDAEVNPDAVETCDGDDNDCDGTVDNGAKDGDTWYEDGDGDGFGNPHSTTTGCDGEAGWTSDATDCDDTRDDTYPGATELCDELDNDCDGEADNGAMDEDTFYLDGDSDGYGAGSGLIACGAPEGYADNNTDCDDTDSGVNPGQSEVCDAANTDEDCNGVADNEDSAATGTSTFYQDGDGDTYGSDTTWDACDLQSGWVTVTGDCDDTAATVNPGSVEVCDGTGVDEDCNGLVDDDDPGASGDATWYPDGDGDGYGDFYPTIVACSQPSGHELETGDCDDEDAAVNPGAQEVCDDADTDEDCDGAADDDDDDTSGWQTWYADADGDGYGDADTTSAACDASSGWVSNAEDCDDSDTSVSPDATETWYDGIDQDCDALSDYDADQDGYAYDAYGGTDCDDTNADISPAATETWYDGTDQDCDAASDWDADADGHDSQTYGGDDCDDHDASVNPSALEADADKDNDCDGDIEAMPTASATYDTSTSSLLHCDMIQLDGSGSADDAECAPPESSDSASSDSASPDTGSAATCPLTYSWTLDEAPASSARTTSDIAEPDDESPIFYPDVAGDYAFSLVVTDEGGAVSETESFDLTIGTRPTNSAPTASAGDDQTLTETSSCSYSSYVYTCDDCSDASVTLDSSSTSDADSDQLTYAWAITAGDKSGELDATDIESPTLTVWGVAAEHDKTSSVQIDVELTVTDCYGTSSTDTVSITYTCTGE